MGSSLVFQSASRGRFVFLMALALILAASSTGQSGTLAYFIATATNPGNTLSTVTLNISTTPSGASFFSLANMVPGDYSLNLVTIANGAANSNGNFTYNLASTASPTSLLDSNAPTSTATSGGAILLLRCTSDVAATTPLACNTVNVYITQVYPTAGAGTQVRILTAGGLAAAVVGAGSTNAGNLVTAGDLIFQGIGNGDFIALDARTGKQVFKHTAKSGIRASPMTFQVKGRQYVSIVATNTILTFALP